MPTLKGTERMTSQFHIRLSPDEKAAIYAHVSARFSWPWTPSTWAREVLLDKVKKDKKSTRRTRTKP